MQTTLSSSARSAPMVAVAGESAEESRIAIEKTHRLVDSTHEVEPSMNAMAAGTAGVNRFRFDNTEH
jgi:hypothetical protein